MTVESVVIGAVVKLLRDDPTAKQLAVLNRTMHRLAYGYYLDGVLQLQDAANRPTDAARQPFVEKALEAFRSGYNRNEPPTTSLCAEAVWPCHDALGDHVNANRWLETAYQGCVSDWINAGRISKSDRGSTVDRGKSFVESTAMFVKKAMQKDHLKDHLDELLPDDNFGRTWRTIFMSEALCRRLLKVFETRGVVQELRPDAFIFPAEAIPPISTWSGQGGGYVVGYRTASGASKIIPEMWDFVKEHNAPLEKRPSLEGKDHPPV